MAGILLACLLVTWAIRAMWDPERRWRLAAEFAVIATLIACVAVVASSWPAAGSRPAAGSTPTHKLPELRFNLHGSPALCQLYDGTGTIPKGYDLLIFDKPVNGKWYLEGRAQNQRSGGWRSSKKIHIDSNPMIISAALVPAATGDFLLHKVRPFSQVKSDRPKIKNRIIWWLSKTLPPSAETIGVLTVRPPDGLHKKCPSQP